MKGGIGDWLAQNGWVYVVIIILAIIAFVWLTCTFSTSACECEWFGRLCRVLPWSSCGKNNAGSSGTSAIPNVDDRNGLPIAGYLAYVPAGDNRCLFYKIKNYPTIELNIHELERLSLSPRHTNDVSTYVVVNADKMRETRREYDYRGSNARNDRWTIKSCQGICSTTRK